MVGLLVTALACFLASYFSASHSVLQTFSRKRLGDLLEQRGRSSDLDFVLEALDRLLLLTGLLRVCFGMVVVLATLYVMQGRIGGASWFSASPYMISFGISAVLLGVFVVAIPGSWARYRAERLLAWSVPVMRVLLVGAAPVLRALWMFDPVVRRLSGVDLRDDDEDLAEEVLAAVEDHEEGDTVAEDQKQMIEAVFDLRDTDAGAVMTPRTDIQGLELDATLEQVKTAVLAMGHSRVPVYRENLDDIAGILYAKDLIRLLNLEPSSGAGTPAFNLKDLLREPLLIPESKKVLPLLHEFRATKIHMAIVLDEYGGTAGLITFEDILEEIVGEIQDEYEPEDDEPGVEPINDRTFRVDARMHIDNLNDKLDLELPEDEDYDTVGGFVFASLGHIPEAGEVFEAHGVKVAVGEAQRTKVIWVTVEKLESAGVAAEG